METRQSTKVIDILGRNKEIPVKDTKKNIEVLFGSPTQNIENIENIENKKDDIPEHVQKSLESLRITPKPGPIPRYPRFEQSSLSTRTIISNTNIQLDKDFYKILPITEYVVVPKKRGRRKKVDVTDPNADIPDGSIITIIPEGGGETLGVDLKNSGKATKKRRGFRNSITIVMICEKRINIKASFNGSFQITGCKHIDQAVKCVKFLWKHIRNTNVYKMRNLVNPKEPAGTDFEAYFRPVMCNVSFDLGFMINREKLDSYFVQNYPQYPSFWEPSLGGSAGANTKFPIVNLENIKIKKLRFSNCKWFRSYITYKQHQAIFPSKKNEERFTTFLTFHRGNVNMSSADLDIMSEPYYKFIQIIDECRDEIEEKLELDD